MITVEQPHRVGTNGARAIPDHQVTGHGGRAVGLFEFQRAGLHVRETRIGVGGRTRKRERAVALLGQPRACGRAVDNPADRQLTGGHVDWRDASERNQSRPEVGAADVPQRERLAEALAARPRERRRHADRWVIPGDFRLLQAHYAADKHHRRAHHPELSLVDRVRRAGITR